MEKLRNYFAENPLKSMLWVAFLLRMIAVVFAKGFGMFDDHFLIIESSQSWVDGADYNNWLPWNQVNPYPTGHSLFYSGIHYILFSIMKFIGIENPDIKMFIVRFLHAIYSLLIISLTYKITLKLSNPKSANIVGWLLVFAWFMPWLSVRNLVEIVSIPPMLAGVWLIIRNDNHDFKKYFWAGFIIAISFSIRFQAILFIGGVGLVLLFKRPIKWAFVFGLGALVSIFVIQGGIDMFIWHRPFAEFQSYVEYNLSHSGEYPNGAWYNYILLLVAFFVPPYGLMLLAGFLKPKKEWMLLFVPTLVFFAFHSYFPNKQERFIFPILPMYLSLAIMGWNSLLDGKLNNKFWKRFTQISFAFFLIVNFIVLPYITTSYYKRSRVEAMLYFYGKKELKSIAIDGTNKNGAQLLPRFYSGNNWDAKFRELNSIKSYSNININDSIEYVLFFAQDDLQQRINKVEERIGPIHKEFVALPSSMDRLLQKMNPHNANDTIFIYSTNLINEKH
jgi:hypothetical protein